MEVAGLTLAIVATVDLCLKYGNIFIDVCATFRDAESQIDERILRVRSYWKRTSLQLDFLKQIWQSLDEEHQTIQSEILGMLASKLKAAISKFSKLEKPNDRSLQGQGTQVKRWKFVFVKESLDKVIQDLANWQELFDPSWFLIMRVADPVIDKELTKHSLGKRDSEASVKINASVFRNAAREEPLQMQSIFLPENGLKDARIRVVPHSSAMYVQRAGSDKWLIVDVDIGLVKKDIRTLAKKLSCGDPYRFGILQCRGAIEVAKDGGGSTLSFDLVFNIPQEFRYQPDTLRSILESRRSHTLTERTVLAKQLARSISYIHTLGFVHKNVRPETILRFHNQDSRLGLFSLVGFEKIRTADGRTLQRGDIAWEKNIYRHPDRQGLRPEEMYTMQHDIYSLGVCLLEIGIWDSFVSYTQGDAVPTPTGALRLHLGDPEFSTPLLMKDHLVALAKSKLPESIREIYGKVVVNCLTCLDKDNPDFGDESEFQDSDGVLVGVRYIEKVCHFRKSSERYELTGS
ncbi:hypothetical protein LTR56_008337 [Elasticomyces elasticus]|nr:hypothetical protein LTR56_008337 [Elasticomyces elasticus]KAK3661473.1 hypothetical protein LTR22_007483 [Elasticomyces elasticus]KAK5756894.1 hypothetical protein LTS12_012973 [Elasticomyces elasticus]